MYVCMSIYMHTHEYIYDDELDRYKFIHTYTHTYIWREHAHEYIYSCEDMLIYTHTQKTLMCLYT